MGSGRRTTNQPRCTAKTPEFSFSFLPLFVWVFFLTPSLTTNPLHGVYSCPCRHAMECTHVIRPCSHAIFPAMSLPYCWPLFWKLFYPILDAILSYPGRYSTLFYPCVSHVCCDLSYHHEPLSGVNPCIGIVCIHTLPVPIFQVSHTVHRQLSLFST